MFKFAFLVQGHLMNIWNLKISFKMCRHTVKIHQHFTNKSYINYEKVFYVDTESIRLLLKVWLLTCSDGKSENNFSKLKYTKKNR